MTRVLLVDDHTLFLDGLELLLKRFSGQYLVVGKINEPLKAIDFLENTPVDLVLLDIEMPGVNGVDLLRRILSRFPNVRVAVVTMHDEDQFIQEVMTAGGHGYLLKSWDSDDLLQKVNYVVKGIKVFPSRPKRVSQSEHFSDRETEILRLLGKGRNSYEIAEELFITINTVKTHRRNMLRKLKATNTSQLLKFGFDNNLI
ncbi:MAG: response regulator transcription factor [Bacteroidia bacterium]|nr:response regulator transcription factor [Bacteroidia bacterium]